MHRTALVLVALLACNDGGDGTGSTGSTIGPGATDSASDTSDGATTPTSAPTSETVTTGDVTDAATTTTGAPDTSSSGDATSSGTTGEARGLKISLADVAIVVDCQPIIADDPLQASWIVVYDNSDGQTDASAELDSVFFIIAEGDPPTAQPLTALPSTSGTIPAGQVVMQKAMKTMGPDFPDCEFCGVNATLVVNFLVGGEQVFAEHTAPLECAD